MQDAHRASWVACAAVALLVAGAPACGGGGGTSEPEPEPLILAEMNGSPAPVEVPSTVLEGQSLAQPFTLQGDHFGPVGGTATVTFGDPDGADTTFDGQPSVDVSASIDGPTTLSGRLPTITAPRLGADVVVDVSVRVPDGRTATAPNLAAFLAPPSVIDVTNLRAPFDPANVSVAKAQSFLAAVPTSTDIRGTNFLPGATHRIFATAGGPSAPIGSGSLGASVTTAQHITGTSPVDPTLTLDVPTTVRVTNPDQQYDDAAILYSVRDVLPNVNVTRQLGTNAESFVAVNPTNPANAVVFAHADPADTQAFDEMVVAWTTDHGLTWTPITIDETLDGFAATDLRFWPTVEFDRFGNGYLCYGVVGSSLTTVVLFQSANGGASFGNLRILAQGSGFAYDAWQLATGPEPVTGGEAVYAAFTDFSTTSSPIVVNGCVSTGLGNLGAPFAPAATPVVVTNGAAPNLQWQVPHPEVGPGGELYVCFVDIPAGAGPAPMNIYLDVDPDGLWSATNGFGADALIATSNLGWKAFIPPQPQRGCGAKPQVVAVRAGPHAGRLVLAYTQEVPDDQSPQSSGSPTPNSNTFVVVRVSDTLGATWSAEIPVHTDTPEHQFLPRLACDRATGELYATWYDCRDDPANVLTRRMAASSPDGTAWTPELLLAQGTSSAAGNLAQDYLNYCGVNAHDGCVYACWSDFSNFTNDNPDGSVRCDTYVSVYMQR